MFDTWTFIRLEFVQLLKIETTEFIFTVTHQAGLQVSSVIGKPINLYLGISSIHKDKVSLSINVIDE